MGGIRLTDENKADIVRMRLDGYSYDDIVKVTGFHRNTCMRICKESGKVDIEGSGHHSGGRRLSTDKKQDILEKIDTLVDSESPIIMSALAKELNTTYPTLCKLLEKNGYSLETAKGKGTFIHKNADVTRLGNSVYYSSKERNALTKDTKTQVEHSGSVNEHKKPMIASMPKKSEVNIQDRSSHGVSEDKVGKTSQPVVDKGLRAVNTMHSSSDKKVSSVQDSTKSVRDVSSKKSDETSAVRNVSDDIKKETRRESSISQDSKIESSKKSTESRGTQRVKSVTNTENKPKKTRTRRKSADYVSREDKIAYCDAYYGKGNWKFMTMEEVREMLKANLVY